MHTVVALPSYKKATNPLIKFFGRAFVLRGGKMQRSLDVTWNITKKCLFNCKICATKNNRIELNKDEKQLLVESLCSSKEYSIHELDFAGGDPLVDPDSVETICLAQRNLGKEKVSVTTTWRGIDALNKRKN